MNLFKKLESRITKARSGFIYRLEQMKYAAKRPALSETDRQIVQEINREGVAVRSLESIGLLSNQSFHQISKSVVQELKNAPLSKPEDTEYKVGFRHCTPINPTKIARHYPALYLWGLNDRILDIVENCIGLPVAYHGVIARKEINDGKQVGTRLWHQDQDDRNIIRITIYLNDVGIDDGPFEYISKPLTPSIRAFKKANYVISDEAMAKVVPPSKWKACTGSAGTIIFAAAAKVFHHGRVPCSSHERIAVSYHYTSQQPTQAELCKTFSFKAGIPFLTQRFNARQLAALWEYRELLPKFE